MGMLRQKNLCAVTAYWGTLSAADTRCPEEENETEDEGRAL